MTISGNSSTFLKASLNTVNKSSIPKANEEDKNCSRALSVVSTVVRAAIDLLHRALAVDGKIFFFTSLIVTLLNC